MFSILLATAVLAAQPTAVSSTSDGSAAADGALWAQAKENRAKVKTPPAFIEGPRAELPEAEKALGHHGPVVIEGIIGVDGRMTEVRVKRTSHAPLLDEIAVDAARASTFTPAKDANGVPLSIIVAMPFDLVAFKSDQEMGIMQYTCEQFVRDMDWWKSVNPDKPFKDHELYKLESGMEFAAVALQANRDNAKLEGFSAEFDQRWLAAIAYCRKKPRVLQRDAIFR